MRKSCNYLFLSCFVCFLLFPALTPLHAQTSPTLPQLEARLLKGESDTALFSQLMQAGRYFLDKSGSAQTDIDSALRAAGDIANASRKNNYQRGIGLSQLLQAMAMREAGKTEFARQTSLQAFRQLTRYGTLDDQAQAILEHGATYSNNDQEIADKIKYYEQGAALYGRLNQTLKQAQLKEFIGDLYHVKRDYSIALQVLTESLDLYQRVHYDRLQGIYALMGVVYSELDIYVKALQYNLLAIKTAEKVGDNSSLMLAIYNRLGVFYADTYGDSLAIYYYTKGLNLARRLSDSAGIQNLLNNLSDVYKRQGLYQQALDTLRVAEAIQPVTDDNDRAYFAMGYLRILIPQRNLTEGRRYFDQLVLLYQNGNLNERVKQSVRLQLATYLQASKQYAASVPYLTSYNQLKKEYPLSIQRSAIAERLWSRSDSAAGNLSGALVHYQEYKKLADSASSIDKAHQMGQLQLAFETEKKDKDIAQLQHRDALQQTTLLREKNIRHVIIGAVIILLAFCGTLYQAYRIKQKANGQLEAQQQAIHKQNEQLKKLLGEKEWLLKEIHHRVKNNLQIVISLLNSQSAYLDNEAAIAAIQNSQHRMHAMSLIHQKLYQTDNLTTINMPWYFRELAEYMKHCFSVERKIEFALNIAPVELDVVQAVPVGLILNEAVSNAIKYAFPGERRGIISIALQATGGNCQLTIADNGIGLPEGFNPENSDSLGMNLMQGLSAQLGGGLELLNNNGLFIRLQFTISHTLPATEPAEA
jgi:two-component sensor histidine kinase